MRSRLLNEPKMTENDLSKSSKAPTFQAHRQVDFGSESSSIEDGEWSLLRKLKVRISRISKQLKSFKGQSPVPTPPAQKKLCSHWL